MDTIKTLNRYKFFFYKLAHPAFIAIIGKDKSLEIEEFNDQLLDSLSRGNEKIKLKGKKFEELLKLLFPREEKLIIEYLNAIDFILENISKQDLRNIDIPEYDNITVFCDLLEEKSPKFLIQSVPIEGIRSNILLPNIPDSIYLELFSIPHLDLEDDRVIGIQGVLPIVNKRRNEYLKFLKQSNRNAIAKVMARNMSHNIGSHVLSRMVDIHSVGYFISPDPKNFHYITIEGNNLADVIEKKSKIFLKKNFQFKSFSTEEEKIKNLLEEQSKALYYNNLLSYFFSYLKTRQDLLADIVTGIPKMQSSKWFIQEIIKGIDKNYLLLNKISGVEEFIYRFEFEGEISKDGKDVEVAIFNDIIGQHCIYIILENIIRNTAKHGQKYYTEDNKTDDVIFSIRVKTSLVAPSYYQVTIFDNVLIDGILYLKIQRESGKMEPYDWYYNGGNENNRTKIASFSIEKEAILEIKKEKHKRAYLESSPQKRVYVGSQIGKSNDVIYDFYEITKINQLVIQQNIWINEPILDSGSFDLRQGALGLIEMEVCTAYLRGIAVEKIEASEFELSFNEDQIRLVNESIKKGETKPMLLRAVQELPNEDKAGGFLGYQFYLPKPKELLILDFEGALWESVKQQGDENDEYSEFRKLEDYGILLLNSNCSNSKWKYCEENNYEHLLMLVVGNVNKMLNKSKLPKRSINIENVKECFKKYENKFEYDKLYDYFSYSIEFNLIKNPSFYIKEVWRAYIFTRMKMEGIAKFNDDNLDDLFPSSLEGKEYDIIYDCHGSSFFNIEGNKWNGEYYVIYESKFEDLVTKCRVLNNDFTDVVVKFKAIEAALTNVLILDERIQEIGENHYTLEGKEKDITYKEIWNYMHVYIPSKEELNLSVKVFKSDYIERIATIIKKQFGHKKRKKSGLDFVIIHLGVLEKMLNTLSGKSKNNEEDLVEIIKKISSTIIPSAEVIITSGRAPSELPKDIPFLSYSLLSQYLIEDRFKLFLSEIIYAARPKS